MDEIKKFLPFLFLLLNTNLTALSRHPLPTPLKKISTKTHNKYSNIKHVSYVSIKSASEYTAVIAEEHICDQRQDFLVDIQEMLPHMERWCTVRSSSLVKNPR